VNVKKKTDPAPAQRGIDPKLPEGAVFDGYVQAMEFRFPTKELMVPMRLSAYNEGHTRNIVYLISDKPAKIRNIPEEYVVRQMSGHELFDNLTKPLPLRILGGDVGDIGPAMRRDLALRRDPTPHNAVAAEIFAADLLAAKTGNLMSTHEEVEKQLLSIGEELELRGEAFDAAIQRELNAQRDAVKKTMLAELKKMVLTEKMVLTVVDGDFPREVLGKADLTFAEYHMPRRRSTPEFYDAKQMGPGGKKAGILKLGAIDWPRMEPAEQIGSNQGKGQSPGATRSIVSSGLFISGVALLLAAGGSRRFRRRWLSLAIIIFVGSLLLRAATAAEPSPVEKYTAENVPALLRELADPAKARQAVAALSSIGEPAAARVAVIAQRDESLARRGWAIAALGNIGGEEAKKVLHRLAADQRQAELIRIWANAALIKQAEPGELDKLINRLDQHPALERPLAKRIERSLTQSGEKMDVVALLKLCVNAPKYHQVLAQPILSAGPQPLAQAMLQAEDQDVRQKAAGFLGSLEQSGDTTVAAAVAASVAFDPEASEAPWKGGPLFIPGLQWTEHQDDAKQLVRHLIAWHEWTVRRGDHEEQRKIDNVLSSVGLMQAAGHKQDRAPEGGGLRWSLD
jgi:hypothetical protein